MVLSDELISQLVKVTDDRPVDKGGAVVYGTIRNDGGRNYVQIDGSDSFAPVETTVEIAPGDRVSVSIRNHTATVTGNISDPAIGTKTADGLRSSIEQTAASIRMELSDEVNKLDSSLTLTAQEIRSELSDGLNGIDSKVTQNASSISTLIQKDEEFSKFQQTVEGFSFMGKGGSVKINGGDIVLTGCIKFEDLNSEVTDAMDSTAETANNALDTANDADRQALSALAAAHSANKNATDAMDKANAASIEAAGALSAAEVAGRDAGNALVKADSAQEAADAAYELAQSPNLPSYLKSTYIDETTVMSPTLIGGQFYAVDENSFAEMNGDGLYVYCEDMTNPKIKLTYTESMVQMILGAGQNNDTSYLNRFFIQKGTDRVGLYYYDRSGNLSGFTFGENSTITVHGSGIGTSTTVTAVWG